MSLSASRVEANYKNTSPRRTAGFERVPPEDKIFNGLPICTLSTTLHRPLRAFGDSAIYGATRASSAPATRPALGQAGSDPARSPKSPTPRRLPLDAGFESVRPRRRFGIARKGRSQPAHDGQGPLSSARPPAFPPPPLPLESAGAIARTIARSPPPGTAIRRTGARGQSPPPYTPPPSRVGGRDRPHASPPPGRTGVLVSSSARDGASGLARPESPGPRTQARPSPPRPSDGVSRRGTIEGHGSRAAGPVTGTAPSGDRG